MTREEAKAIIEDWYEEAKGKNGCIGHIERFLEKEDEEAFLMAIEALRTVQEHEETFEWCNDCKEYDKENHCCHRWNKVIRSAIKDTDIVNCCGCIHWKTDGGAIMECELLHMPTKDFDYCSYGRRGE